MIKPYYADMVQPPDQLSVFQDTVSLLMDDKEYDLYDYNCVNYTDDTYPIAQSMGLDAYKVVGCNVNNISQCHEWMRIVVDYEPIDNKIVDYSNIYTNVRIVG